MAFTRPASKAKKAKSLAKTQKRKVATRNPATKKVTRTKLPITATTSLLTSQKRFGGGHVALDKQGRPLPIDYQTHVLHDPYEYFQADTSKVFDENYHIRAERETELLSIFPKLNTKLPQSFVNKMHKASQLPDQTQFVQLTMVAEQHLDKQEAKYKKEASHQIQKYWAEFKQDAATTRSNITDQHEQEAYDNTLGYILSANKQKFPSIEETDKLLEANGYSDVPDEPQSWKEFFTHGLENGTPADRVKYIAASAVMWSCSMFLAYEAFSAADQYFYDIIHPHHH